MSMVAFAAVWLISVGGLVAAAVIYNAIVLWIMWGWFIMPLGFPHLTISWAVGVSAVALLLGPTIPQPQGDLKWEHNGNVLLKPAFVLAIGFIAKMFM